MVMEGVLPIDDPLEAFRWWTLRYRVSLDGGHTTVVDEPVTQEGHTAEQPFEGVLPGKVGMIMGDITQTPIRTRGGTILVPTNLTVLGPDGRYANPGGSLCFLDAAVLIGRRGQDYRIRWELSDRVSNDPARSSRGCLEPTLAQAPDGRILMVMRGSNDAIPDQPGVKWSTISHNEGRTWSTPEPWTYADGGTLFSPGSSSQLLQHSGGVLYWLGNITPENPRGSYPRYPLVIGRVDPASLLLARDTVFVIDTWQQPDEPTPVMLSSFMAHEDRQNGDILLHMTRAFRDSPDQYWTGDAYLYRLEP